MAQLIDLHQEFHLGNDFILNTANELAKLLPDKYRIIVKYDLSDLPSFNDDLLNIEIATSRETHDIPHSFFRNDVYAIFQNYFMLDKWEQPIYNPLVYPMPLGTFVNFSNIQIPNIKPIPERKYDFCFIGQIPHTGTRDAFKRGLDNLLNKTGNKFKYFVEFTSGFNSGHSHIDYINILNDSKIALCPQGANSLETFRFFESIKMGAIPMVERLPRLWYYESAPFFKCKWHNLDFYLSKSLNYLNNISSKHIYENVARYNVNVLEESNLAKYLYQVLKNRDSANIETMTNELEKLRRELIQNA